MTHPLFAPDIKFDEPYWWETASPPEERTPELPARVDVAIVGGGYLAGDTIRVDLEENAISFERIPGPEHAEAPNAPKQLSGQ